MVLNSFVSPSGANKFTFTVAGITNAPSTQPTAKFYNIYATDKSGYKISEDTSNSGPTVTNTAPAIATGSLT